MNFTCICQCFADIYTLLEVQLQEASGLDKFHMTSKVWMMRTNSLSLSTYTHACTHSLTPSYKDYVFDIITITS